MSRYDPRPRTEAQRLRWRVDDLQRNLDVVLRRASTAESKAAAADGLLAAARKMALCVSLEGILELQESVDAYDAAVAAGESHAQ